VDSCDDVFLEELAVLKDFDAYAADICGAVIGITEFLSKIALSSPRPITSPDSGSPLGVFFALS
jgi:hypothetical protein